MSGPKISGHPSSSRPQTLEVCQSRLIHLERLNSLYLTLFPEEEVLLKARSETEMLRRICHRMIENHIFIACWIGRPDVQRESAFRYLATAGRGVQTLRGIRLRLDQPGPVGVRAWISGKLEYSNDYQSDPSMTPWQEFLAKYHWAAGAAAPVWRDSQPWGVLVVVSEEKGVFSQETLSLVARMAKLLGHSLDEFDLKDRLEKEHIMQGWLARHDPLTTLPNRTALLDRIPEAMARARRQKTLLAIGMLDLDDFKPVNDMHGHAAGDALLRELSKRLQKVLRQTDLLARLGGDEFVFVLENVTRMSDLELLLKRVRQAIETPFVLPDGGSVQVGGSMGITFYPSNAKESSAEGLLRHADHVLYLVKAKKGKRTRFWDWDWEYVIDPYQQGK